MATPNADQTFALEHALRAHFGDSWYLRTAHPQTVRDYMLASTEAARASARATMQRDAVVHAMQCLHAGIVAGLVKLPD